MRLASSGTTGERRSMREGDHTAPSAAGPFHPCQVRIEELSLCRENWTGGISIANSTVVV
jgi:hypothetical protein